MSTAAAAIRTELLAYSTPDPVVAAVLEATWRLVGESAAVGALDELTLCLLNPAVASPELMGSHYFTASCQALRAEKLIVVNERFLLELETVIRAFEQADTLLGSQYLKSDEQMFGLVRRIQQDPTTSLGRFRRQAQRASADPEADENLRLELVMVSFFFVGHELGHLLAGHESGQFGAFVDPALPLEDQIEDAVVKLCRHVDEFAPSQFGLPGMQQLEDKTSDVRKAAERYRARSEALYLRQEAFFEGEEKADEWANRIVIEHLAALAQKDAVESEKRLHLLARGVFVAALYTWYRDLDVFGRKMGIEGMRNARDLGHAMMQGREKYVHAASLFGEYHRFTLLRAALALEAVLRARTQYFAAPVDGRTLWCKRTPIEVANDLAARREWWLSESLQRYALLCISMDTAVKLASFGCANRGGDNMLIVSYESIDQAVARLRRLS